MVVVVVNEVAGETTYFGMGIDKILTLESSKWNPNLGDEKCCDPKARILDHLATKYHWLINLTSYDMMDCKLN